MTIRTAVLGYGVGGRVFHAPLIAADPRFAVTAIVTADPVRAAAAAAEYPAATVHADAAAVFAADDIDLVVVTTPNETHVPLATRAIDSGKAVVVDKPVAVDSRSARDLVAHAEAAGVPLTVFQNRRWDGDFLTVRDVIASGELGEIHQFDSAFEWWAPQVGTGWKDTTVPADGGGILFDLGPHLVDQALQLFGEVDDIHAELDRRRPGAANDDDSFLSLTHRGGVRTRLWMSAVSPANRPRFRVVGSKGVFVSSGLDPQEPQSLAGLRPHDPGFGVREDVATISNADGARTVAFQRGDHLAFYRALADALLDGAPLPVDPHDSIRALGILERARDIA